MLKNDPSTGLPWGDHGTANEAIEWFLGHSGDHDESFLRAWREGDAARYWPEFYEWLRERRGV